MSFIDADNIFRATTPVVFMADAARGKKSSTKIQGTPKNRQVVQTKKRCTRPMLRKLKGKGERGTQREKGKRGTTGKKGERGTTGQKGERGTPRKKG